MAAVNREVPFMAERAAAAQVQWVLVQQRTLERMVVMALILP
jgi:hypothetical protein